MEYDDMIEALFTNFLFLGGDGYLCSIPIIGL